MGHLTGAIAESRALCDTIVALRRDHHVTTVTKLVVGGATPTFSSACTTQVAEKLKALSPAQAVASAQAQSFSIHSTSNSSNAGDVKIPDKKSGAAKTTITAAECYVDVIIKEEPRPSSFILKKTQKDDLYGRFRSTLDIQPGTLAKKECKTDLPSQAQPQPSTGAVNYGSLHRVFQHEYNILLRRTPRFDSVVPIDEKEGSLLPSRDLGFRPHINRGLGYVFWLNILNLFSLFSCEFEEPKTASFNLVPGSRKRDIDIAKIVIGCTWGSGAADAKLGDGWVALDSSDLVVECICGRHAALSVETAYNGGMSRRVIRPQHCIPGLSRKYFASTMAHYGSS
ncbi:uncharacterized protein BCR38DRAFT_471128 [Pseudomassariella vexata]|uniref:Uncharacterized protein n=1 Tax=Pseudomassariella vexata TaxID=1141098 RepID=A0A1Y2EDK3_9PEZI|nr:uncharacterized protein BCR38DRAFT_471128 [Pseudomassariella vexata]ORY69659.1 hypothetical protein BCR38DRAFT_471128 [Pseudomassariella vexata]